MSTIAGVAASPLNWFGLFIGAALFAIVFPRRNFGPIGWPLAVCANIPVAITITKQPNDPVGLVDFLSLLGLGGFGLGAIVGMAIRTRWGDKLN